MTTDYMRVNCHMHVGITRLLVDIVISSSQIIMHTMII